MNFKNDVVLSLRRLRKDLGFTGIAVAILALGIGVNTAIFSLVNVILLRPIAGVAADRIVGLFQKDQTKPDSYRAFSYPDYKDIREGNEIFESVMAHNFAMVGLTEGDVTRRVFSDVVSSNYFQTLGVRLHRGRAFSQEEETPGRDTPVAILGYGLWKKMGASESVLGTQVKINAKDFTVIGVAPDGFSGTMALAAPELWLPLSVYDSTLNDFQKSDERGRTKLADRTHHNLILVGQLRQGVTLDAASAQATLIGSRLASAYPENKDQALTLAPLSRLSVSTNPVNDAPIAAANGILLALASVVLIVACFNLANMLLARGEARQKEIALRLALGSGRWRVVRQLLTEGFVLALLGGAFGLGIAYALTRLLVSSFVAVAPLAIVFPMTPDVRVLAATFVFCLFATVVSGLGPAMKLSRLDVFPQLKEQAGEGGALSSARGRFWMLAPRNVLVVLQIGLSLALLATGGLFVRGSLAAANSDPGFRLDSGLLFELDPALAGYDTARSQQLYGTILDRVRALPGVEASSVATTVPFGTFSNSSRVRKAGTEERDGSGKALGISAQHVKVGTDYFKSLGLTMRRGREFDLSEERGVTGLKVVVINEPLAKQLFGDEDPIGRTIQFGGAGDTGKGVRISDDVDSAPSAPDALQIVGVAPGLRQGLFDPAPVPFFYEPIGANFQSGLNLHVRIKSPVPVEASAMVQKVRSELRSIDVNLPVVSAATLQSFRDESIPLWAVRSGARLFSLFGLAALILAIIGIYGLKSYVVARRTREIGIRMALGATSRGVVSLLLREGTALAGAGLSLGVLLALGAGRLVSSMLYQVSSFDPAVLLISFLILAVAALIATYIPARRATLVSPVSALRHE